MGMTLTYEYIAWNDFGVSSSQHVLMVIESCVCVVWGGGGARRGVEACSINGADMWHTQVDTHLN